MGALAADSLPGRDLGLVITLAVLVALVLLFTKLKHAIESSPASETRFGIREVAIFCGIGIWLGFIVLDGATYLLLALVLAVHMPLVEANALKTLALIPTTAVALAVFAADGVVDWGMGAVMGAGGFAGGVLGARLAASSFARTWVFRLLVIVIIGELVQLAIHYVFNTA